MDDRMIEQFVDEDDFIINLDFDNQLGHFELTLQYWNHPIPSKAKNYIIYKYFSFAPTSLMYSFFQLLSLTCVKWKYNM